MIEFCLLGPVEMRASGLAHPVRGITQQILLLALLLSANQIVRPETLRYELWGASWPDSSENALHAHISRLRRRLKRAEAGRGHPRLLSDRTGYQLLVKDEEVDGRRFCETVGRLERQASAMRPEHLVRALRQALSAWRGPVFGGALGGPICRIGGRRYEETRYEALALLFDAELRSGNHAHVIAELCPLVNIYSPFLEGFSEQLMIALYRSGRQVEALEVYQQTVRRLIDHGDTPSERLKNCEQAILTQAAALDLDPCAPPVTHGFGLSRLFT